MKRSDFVTSVVFTDGTTVTLGTDGELFIEQTEEGSKSSLLTDDRLDFIKKLQLAEDQSVND